MFGKIWLFMQSTIVALQQSLEGALSKGAAPALTTGIIFVIFAVYAGMKLWELLMSQTEDTFPRKIYWVWRESRRGFIVYVLVLAAPILISTIGGVAKSYARKSTKSIITAATPAFAPLDECLNETASLFNGLGSMLEANAGQVDKTNRTILQAGLDLGGTALGFDDAAGLNSRERGLLGTGGSMQDSARTYFAKGIAAQQAMLDAAKATNNPDRIAAAQAAFQDYRRNAADAMAKASQAGANVYLDLNQKRAKRKSELWPIIQGQWYEQYLAGKAAPDNDPKRATPGFQNWDQFTNGGELPDYRRMILNNQLNTVVEAELKAEEDRAAGANAVTDWIPGFGWRILGLLGALVCMISMIAAGVQIFKAAYGVLMLCVGFVATVTFGFALATPISPAFMLTFLSDRTEHWGRNFVSFILGAAFASLGLYLMVSGVGFLFRAITVALLSQLSLELMVVQASTANLGEFAFAVLRFAGLAMVAGMSLSFVGDLVKKGSSIGAGMFTGHFPA